MSLQEKARLVVSSYNNIPWGSDDHSYFSAKNLFKEALKDLESYLNNHKSLFFNTYLEFEESILNANEKPIENNVYDIMDLLWESLTEEDRNFFNSKKLGKYIGYNTCVSNQLSDMCLKVEDDSRIQRTFSKSKTCS